MWHKIFYSFPIQLLLLHFKKNLALVGIWVLLIFIVLGKFGKVLGIPYLFLDPEYLNQVSWLGFFLMGIGFGIYTMAFHMTSYIMDGSRFKFLAVVTKPFLHFCINNSLIPLIFYLIYVYCIIRFQLDNELENNWIIAQFLLGFVGGTVLTFFILFFYFRFTNKDFFVLFADTLDKRLRKTYLPRANIIQRYKERKRVKDHVDNYFGVNLKIQYARPDLARFKAHELLKVFDQNHLNLFFMQLILILFILVLGFFRENLPLQIPAAMSATLLLSILTMMVGAITFWLRSWALSAAVLLFVVVNFFSQTSLLNRPHAAFGLDYSQSPAPYNLSRLNSLVHPDTVKKDKENTLKILNTWKRKFPDNPKPKMVLIATSGGGQRAALWTLKVLQESQIATDGGLFEHTQIITGASGGVIGAAFFRELYLRSLSDPTVDVTDEMYLEQMSSDHLNAIIFTLLVNDLLIRSQHFKYNGHRYLKDRGYAFENQLNINTKGILDKPLFDYWQPEWEAKIPMMPITPLIINDARKLMISPHSMSYMGVSKSSLGGENEKSPAIDFMRFFRDQDAGNLRFISALRMGATFPFFTPNIQLPSDPQMATMDAGLADNFGVQDAMKFAYIFQDWIRENTSGVLLLTIRDSEKINEIKKKQIPSITQKIITPFKNIYINWHNVQTMDNEGLFHYMKENLPFDLERVEFEYSTENFVRKMLPLGENGDPKMQEEFEIQKASLNWRLTAREKKSIINNILTPNNQHSLQRLTTLFSGPK
ncbi:MAG: patatin-like phospholipase family protein [Anditalea sp.]